MWKADWKERLMNKTRSTIFLFKWGESKKLNKMKNENKSKQRKITEKKNSWLTRIVHINNHML